MSSEKQINDSSLENQEQEQQNLLRRVASLPLVSSAYDMAATAYASTKESHPYLKSLCDVAEKGVKTISDAAASRAQPILTSFEPQIAAANEYAVKGLGTLEEKLPSLQITADKAASDTKELVPSKVEACCKFSSLVDVTRDAVQESMESTKSVMTHSVNTVMGSRMGQMAIEYMKQGVDQKLQDGHEKLHQMWLDWSKRQTGGSEDTDLVQAEQLESHALTMFQSIIQQLQATCLTLMSSIQGFPSNIQDKVQQVRHSTKELQASFSTVHSFQDLSSRILTQSRKQVTKAQGYMDELLEYIVHNTPLSWLVGPFMLSGKIPEEAMDPSE
ncbi:perilipin-2-like isoform X2 [Gopherus evgoodei]|uniref:perilipin-2-like isoform X2 n=1 Tax=Gopherus evgoodei TaxID=1825980 RepID=UPI0011CF23E0|nr:perilipin-2-like isoform X2 [Gopherus evgoodei]